jgi:hypothetical protein
MQHVLYKIAYHVALSHLLWSQKHYRSKIYKTDATHFKLLVVAYLPISSCVQCSTPEVLTR